MVKLLIFLTLSLPVLSFGFTDEESVLRDNLVKEHQNSKELEEKIENLKVELDSSFISKFMDEEMKDALGSMIAQNPFQFMSEEQMKTLLIARGGKSLEDNPKVLAFMATWLRDKDALPKFLSIAGEGAKLKKYVIYFLVVFIMAFILNLKNSKNSFFKRLFFKLGLMLTTGLINLGVFYYLFYEELSPTVKIAREFILV